MIDSPEPPRLRDASQTKPLIAVAVVALLAFAIMLLGQYDTTFHSVDSVRDVVVARAIADGREFPLVSQPWAATYQTPPAYLYMLSIPFALGGDERAAFLFVALLCFIGVCWLWWSIRSLWGELPAALYAATALVFPTSVFFHSAGNPSFAFALSTLALCCVLRVASGERQYSMSLVLLLFFLPQMHLSGAPIAAIIALWLVSKWRERLDRPAIAAAALLFIVSLVWLLKFGAYAPEYVVKSSEDSQLQQVVARLLDPRQWSSLATVYVNYARQLVGAPGWLVALVQTLAIYFVLGLTISVRALVRRERLPAQRIVVATAVFTIFTGAAYLETWGVWYFDAWLPWISAAAAVGWNTMLAQRVRLTGLAASVAMLAAVNVVPQAWLHISLARGGYIEISPSALFASRHAIDAMLPIAVVSARHQLAYRDFIALNNLCLANVVGVSSWYMRDMTRRDGYRICTEQERTNAARLHFDLSQFGAALNLPVAWTSGPLQLQTLPPQPQVSIDGERRSSKYGTTLERYGLYLPAEEIRATTVEVELNGRKPDRVRVSLRCLDLASDSRLSWSHSDWVPVRTTVTVDRALLSIRYLEYEFVFPPLERGNTIARIQMSAPLRCDSSVFTY